MSGSVDSGIARLHSEPPNYNEGIQDALSGLRCPSCNELAQGQPMSSLGKILAEVEQEITSQDRVHPSGYPATRDGVRLGLAAAEDEVNEARDAWREGRCKCPTPMCDHADWTDTRTEMIQAVAVLLRTVREMPGTTDV